MRFLVTGGAGFIGSNLVRHLVSKGHQVCNVDALTYAGNLNSLSDLDGNESYEFHQLDIGTGTGLEALFTQARPDAVLHLAAESHVDRSIDGPVFGQLPMVAIDPERELPFGTLRQFGGLNS